MAQTPIHELKRAKPVAAPASQADFPALSRRSEPLFTYTAAL